MDEATKGAMAQTLIASDREAQIEKGKPSIPRVYDDGKLEDFVNSESWIFFRVR